MASSRMASGLGRIWFRSLQRQGASLPPGPCLILLNHTNGLLDPLAAAALLGRRTGWLAKATLWKLAPLRPFLAAFHAIPVTRPKDGGATVESIQQCFQRVHETFARGGSVAMFPEGVSHSGGDLAPLKTGAARMALSSPVPVAVVPAGLVYGDRGAFRHSVLLRVGEPIPWQDLAGQGPEPGAVLALTGRIRAALQALTLHGAEGRALALAQEVAWLLAEGPGSRADLDALHRRVKSLVGHLSTLDEPAIAHLELRVRGAQAWLRAQGLRPDQVGYPYAGAEVRHWLPGAALRLGVALILAVPSSLYWPSHALVGWLATHFTDEGDQVATLKWLGGLLLHPLWALGLSVGCGLRWGGWVALLPVLALLVAGLGRPLLERAQEDLQAIHGFLRRKDPFAPQLLEARRQLLEAFPELAG